MLQRRYTILFYHLIFIILLLFIYITSSIAAKYKSIDLVIETTNTPPKIERKLKEFLKETKKIIKSYNTTNQLAYWKSYCQKSLLELLHSEGYYNATITAAIDENKENRINFYIDPDERYKISKITINFVKDSNRSVILPDIKDLTIKIGDLAIAENIINVQKQIYDNIETHNCLLSLKISNQAIIDNIENTMEVTFVINAGEKAHIDSISFEGLKSVKSKYVKKLVNIKDGVCFKNSLIIDGRKKLQKSGLFASATPEIPEKTDEQGKVAVKFKLKERKHRSIKAGVNYSTDKGLGAKLGWEHRNFFSNGETLSTSISGNQKEQVAEVNYLQKFFKRDDQDLKMGANVKNDDNKAFKSKGGEVSAGIERRLTDIWTTGVGTKYKFSATKEEFETRNFHLIALPVFIQRDDRDNSLDPHSGSNVRLSGAPFANIDQIKLSFFKSTLSASTYFAFNSEFAPVIAIKGKVGSLFGVKASKIPPTERFYSGGSRSVRGYANKLVGPLDEFKRPLGGKALFETSVELRKRFKNDFGVVIFTDSGQVYSKEFVSTKSKILHGAGIGARYYTSFGPLRFDIAFPLNRRKGIDNFYQLSFGIGQSF
ncbi:MAG: BamA/TamA family outer membrane protein [Rickettsiaceae bacterium]|nr:BamA/TamA family outer membrane protein [Rickettsiaceae bacterium]